MRARLLHRARRGGCGSLHHSGRRQRVACDSVDRFLSDEVALLMATPNGSPMISLQHVYKAFAGKQVLRDLSIDVDHGESVVIVGGSGSGKSVTLKHMIGLLRPDQGRILVDGEDIGSMKSIELNRFRRMFGMAFQEGALFDSMSVFENIAFPLRRHTKMGEDEIRARVEECLDMVHLH